MSMFKYTRFAKGVVLGASLMYAGTVAQGKGVAPVEPLPIGKSNLAACQNAVSKLGHGSIERRHSRARNGVSYYIFETREADGTEWLIACDSSDGRVVKAVGLDGL